jgi:hypothetical protein
MRDDRTVRRLTALEESASTARVLNLRATHRLPDVESDLARAPFFQNRLMDRSIILKHRLRPHEYAMFANPKPTATKLLIPIDSSDLRLGARYLFLGQRDFEQVAQELFVDDLRPGSRDREVLELLDPLPSLDPFLLREHLKRNGFEPAQAYFGLSEADIQRMYEFVRKQVMALVAMSATEVDDANSPHAKRLVDKLLSNSLESGFEPLKVTLKLSDREYLDGVFSWRGFLYYKWVLGELTGALRDVTGEIAAIRPMGPKDPVATAYLPDAKRRIRREVGKIYLSVQGMLDIYDKAYASLTRDGKPAAFRDFLLRAPEMFTALGEQLGAIQHIISFWRYRFPPQRMPVAGPSELMDIFLDFEDSLAPASEELARAG